MHLLTRGVVCIVLIREYDDGTHGDTTANASGFLWEHAGNSFIITNWHNVTGRHPDTGDYLGNFCPNFMIANFLYVVEEQSEGRILIQTRPNKIRLYDDFGNKLWIEHEMGSKIDCVAVPIDPSIIEDTFNLNMNKIDILEDGYELTVGDDCFILGFPKGLSGRLATPIWKRGSIASEPALDHDNKPMLLVDSASRKGMSGAPVISKHSGFWSRKGELSDDSIIGTVYSFVGIYSGRTDDDELGVQIGRVWKKDVIVALFCRS